MAAAVVDLVSSEDEDDALKRPAPPSRVLDRAKQPNFSAAGVPQLGSYTFEDYLQNNQLKPTPEAAPPPLPAPPRAYESPPGQWVDVDGEQVFIPEDIPHPPSPHPHQHASAMSVDATALTPDLCLQRVLSIFPDVSHEHVLQLYKDLGHEDHGPSPVREPCQSIVENLLADDDYPREPKIKQVDRKRKREDDDQEDADVKQWERPHRPALPSLRSLIKIVLKAEFPEIPNVEIARQQMASVHLFPTFVSIAHAIDSSDASKRWRGRPKPSMADSATVIASSEHPELLAELLAARKHVEKIRKDRTAEQKEQNVEDVNLRFAIQAGQTAECQVCFDDLPMNRQIHCNGDTAHFTCYDCATSYIASEVGQSRCRVLCTAADCGAGFAHAQLHALDCKQLLEKLEQLMQEKEIRDAGLEDLEECPFCDYKVILPPIDQDFEFRCANPECEKVSCRRCKAISHVPKSCEEHATDNKLNSRHKIEEAMTKALLRQCNKCKKPFIKDFGCNKMACTACGNLQCYVCSLTVTDYHHFDQNPRPNQAGGPSASKCPLYDNVEERHEREVKQAQQTAAKQAREDNPDLVDQDLEIEISDAAQKSTKERARRNRMLLAGGLYGVDEDEEDHADGSDEEFEVARDRLRAERLRRQQHLLQVRARIARGPVPAPGLVQEHAAREHAARLARGNDGRVGPANPRVHDGHGLGPPPGHRENIAQHDRHPIPLNRYSALLRGNPFLNQAPVPRFAMRQAGLIPRPFFDVNNDENNNSVPEHGRAGGYHHDGIFGRPPGLAGDPFATVAGANAYFNAFHLAPRRPAHPPPFAVQQGNLRPWWADPTPGALPVGHRRYAEDAMAMYGGVAAVGLGHVDRTEDARGYPMPGRLRRSPKAG